MIKDKQTNQNSAKSARKGLDRDGLHQGLRNCLKIKTHTKEKTKLSKEQKLRENKLN